MRVLIADGHQGIRESLSASLEQHGVQVVGVAGDGLDAVEKAQSLAPDIVLLDIHVSRCGGLEAARVIGARMPHPKIILLTTWDEEAYARAATRIGATTCLPKTVPTQDLVAALISAMADGPAVRE